MTMLATLSTLPLAAVVTTFVLVFLPILLLMAVWTSITMMRILFPERPLPFDGSNRITRARQRGEMVPVRLHDLLVDQRHAPAPAMPRRATTGEAASDDPDPLAEDLWRRRN